MIETTLIDYLAPLLNGVNLALDEAANSSVPLIELSVLSEPKNRTTELTSNHLTIELEIECWNKNAVSAKALCEQLRTALQDYRGVMGTYFVFAVRFYNEFSGYSKDKLYYRNTTINISYKKG
jgi:hypothetical protein